MTPEEAGLNIPEEQSLLKQPFLRPKTEPLSDNSDLDSEENDSTSDGEENSNVNRLSKQTQQNTPNNAVLHLSFPSVRTKAARKQLPFNLVVSDKKVVKLPSSCNSSLISEGEVSRKANANKTNSDGKMLQKNLLSRGKFVSGEECSDTSQDSNESCESNVHVQVSTQLKSNKLNSSKDKGCIKQNLNLSHQIGEKSKCEANSSLDHESTTETLQTRKNKFAKHKRPQRNAAGEEPQFHKDSGGV